MIPCEDRHAGFKDFRHFFARRLMRRMDKGTRQKVQANRSIKNTLFARTPTAHRKNNDTFMRIYFSLNERLLKYS